MKLIKVLGILAYTGAFALVLSFADSRIRSDEPPKHITPPALSDVVVLHAVKKVLHSI